jgi:hypothetical protein
MWVRRPSVRRATSGVAVATFLCAIGGCAEDRAANSVAKRTPIAVTAEGVEIMEVVKHERERTVEAAVVAGGEERQATFAPLLDGPLPFGMVATLRSTNGDELMQIAFGWNEQTETNWVRGQLDGDVFELTQSVVDERRREEYVINGRPLTLEYPDLSPVLAARAASEFRRGAPTTSEDPDVIEFVDRMREFEAFTANAPSRWLDEDRDGHVLISLLGDPAFAGILHEGDTNGAIQPSIIGATCRSLTLCASIACRFAPGSLVCSLCWAGATLCAIVDWICSVLGCSCCYD